MRNEVIKAHNGEKIILTISDDGFCFCPVCGAKSNDKHWRPYDEIGDPSNDICSCGYVFNFDDAELSREKSWAWYRERWLADNVRATAGKRLTKAEKLEQLKNIL
jgi:hypothetical protein